MEDIRHLYSCLLEANEDAFDGQLFKVAYHALSGAMYCALQLQDALKMDEVERRARDQWQAVKNHFPRAYPSSGPTEVGLYASLVEIANVRSDLLRRGALF